ncbi:thioredoxin family protein, partial [Xanthovirga aplysinae]|uniref:thioredoxin family protein n=1 Tax=Xanthovirga aplysinae TaxID=2529853 RepID=UPI0012BD3DC2
KEKDKRSSKKEVKKKQGIQWISIEEAQERTKNEPRKIFVDAYADWCGWCIVMDKKTFKNSNVAEFVNENYYAVKLNAKSNKEVIFNGVTLTEAQLVQAFGVRAYPTIVLINEKFDMVSPAPGYRNPKDFIDLLEKFQDYADSYSKEN